jgi:hypothetical protein
VKAIDALLRGVVDYAGLFPPAGEGMRQAVENYAGYLHGGDRRALGRFIVPISRLVELEQAAAGLLESRAESEPWRLSVLIAGDVGEGVEEIVGFNRRHAPGSGGSGAVIDVVELKASTAEEIAHQSAALPGMLTAYFEIPVPGNVTPLVDSIGRAERRAKIRTGGVTPDAFPAADAVIGFLTACQRAHIPFKATAGLHHPLRGEYRLTYEKASPSWMMYGYLNVFLAAALLTAGGTAEAALAALEESDPASLVFADDAIVWRGTRLTTAQIAASREFAISFGSCSFREPIEELASLTRATTRADQ